MGVKGSSINIDSQVAGYMTLKNTAARVMEIAEKLASDIKQLEGLDEYGGMDAQTKEKVTETLQHLRRTSDMVSGEKFAKLISILNDSVERTTDIQTRSSAAHSASADKMASVGKKIQKR